VAGNCHLFGARWGTSGGTTTLCRELATGIESAFLAWEAHQRAVRYLRKVEYIQLKAICTCPLSFAVVPLTVPFLPARVARIRPIRRLARCGTDLDSALSHRS
jgi:hypothetical protein